MINILDKVLIFMQNNSNMQKKKNIFKMYWLQNKIWHLITPFLCYKDTVCSYINIHLYNRYIIIIIMNSREICTMENCKKSHPSMGYF